MYRKSILRASLFAGILILIQSSAFATPPLHDVDSVQKMIGNAVSAVRPALVRIHVVGVYCDQGREVKEEAFGSGAIISSDGYVITNHHVAGETKQISCTLSDRTEVDAKLVGTDPSTDIAIIKLTPEKPRTFQFAKFGDSSLLKVGDSVFAMGCPLAFSQSVTMGVISNTELVMPDRMHERLTQSGEDVGSMVKWIAHDAAIFPGNSGGPLVNIDGEIVGINEIKIGLSGAIPGNLAHSVADQIIKNGKVKRSWFGFSTQPLLKSRNQKEGVLISDVLPNSPAEKAGLRAGDIILSVNNQPYSVRFSEDQPGFNQQMGNMPIDKPVKIQILRGETGMSLTMTPSERPNAQEQPHEYNKWGICASNLTFFAAKEKKREGTNGVLVVSVRPGGPAGEAKPAIKDDDVILDVGGKPVNNLDDFKKVTDQITAGKTEPVPTIITYERNTERYITVCKLGMTELKDPGIEVRKAWLPISTQVLTRDIAEAMGISGRTGVRILQVYPNSTASKAGLKVGDLIVAVDGDSIQASQPEDTEVLPEMIRQYKIGATTKLTVLRAGKELTIPIELAKSPRLAREMKRYKNDLFDFTVRDIAFQDRIDEQWSEEQSGAYVDSVVDGGWASLGDLQMTDLIIALNDKPVTNVETFEKMMKEVEAKKPKSVILTVRRGIHDVFVEICPTWSTD
jgi:serine protease Do